MGAANIGDTTHEAGALQGAARLAHRVPGYRWVRRRAVPRIRRSAAARALATRIFPLESRGESGSPADVTPGRLLAGLGVEQLPLVLISLVDLPMASVKGPRSATLSTP
jgi:hypothetical protein